MQILIIMIRIYDLWIVKSRLNRYETKTSREKKFLIWKIKNVDSWKYKNK